MIKRIGIALSGGGHRATAFCLGSLMYLVDSRQNSRVHAISSVSGGSITNSYIALLDKPFNKLTKSEFRQYSASFACQIAGCPVIWWTAILLALLGFIVYLLPIMAWIRLAVSLILVILSILVGAKSKGTFWGWWGTWFYVNLMLFIVGVFAAGIFSFIPKFDKLWDIPLPRVYILVLIPIFILTFSRRHIIAGLAFGSTIRGPSFAADISLNACPQGDVQHIYCATVLTPGRHFYFSRDFVFADGFGVGNPGAVRLCDAVQASANFPVAFPYRSFKTSTFEFRKTFKADLPKSFLLTDGGVYDNTATAWFLELDELRFAMGRQFRYNRFTNAEKAELEAAYQKVTELQEEIAVLDERISTLRGQIESEESRYIVTLKEFTIGECKQSREILKQRVKTIKENTIPIFERQLREFTAKQAPISSDRLQNLIDKMAPPDELMAVNAAYPQPWKNGGFGLLNIVNVFYNTANFRRFKDLRRSFLTGRLSGALVSIEEAPHVLACYLADPKKWLSSYDPEREELLIHSFGDDVGLSEARARHEDIHNSILIRYLPEKEISTNFAGRAEAALEHIAPGVQDLVRRSREYSTSIDEKLEEAKRLKKVIDNTKADKSHEGLSPTSYEECKRKIHAIVEEIYELKNKKGLHDFEVSLKLKAFEEFFVSKRNTDVSTTLKPLGKKTTAELMRHGYLSSMMLLHILSEDYPLIEAPAPDQFEELATGKAI